MNYRYIHEKLSQAVAALLIPDSDEQALHLAFTALGALVPYSGHQPASLFADAADMHQRWLWLHGFLVSTEFRDDAARAKHLLKSPSDKAEFRRCLRELHAHAASEYHAPGGK